MAATSARVQTHYLTPIPLTPESIRPFGEALTQEGREELTLNYDDERGYAGTIDGFRSDLLLETKEPVEFLMPRFRVREFRSLFQERHPEFTQTYVPVTGQPYVWVLARPEARLDNGFPALDELQAFLNPGDIGVRMHPGTWHEAPFPFRDNLRFVVLSQRTLTDGVIGEIDENGELRKLPWVERLSLQYRLGVEVRIALP
jgi:ureidoglycolate lyase